MDAREFKNMKRTFSAFVLAVGLAASFGANAGFYDGNKLKAKSDADERVLQGRSKGGDIADSGNYLGFVVGVHDVLDGVLFCTPSNASVGQVTAVVTQYLKANPAKWSESATTLVIGALAEAFPCKKK